MIFITESGSTYEVDEVLKKVRRLRGQADPTPRQGSDGNWREFDSISPVLVGQPVLIVWPVPEVVEGVSEDISPVPGTLTSRVQEVRDDIN